MAVYNTKLYTLWLYIRQTASPKSAKYKGYTLCKRWNYFQHFKDDIISVHDGFEFRLKEGQTHYNKDNTHFISVNEHGRTRKSFSNTGYKYIYATRQGTYSLCIRRSAFSDFENRDLLFRRNYATLKSALRRRSEILELVDLLGIDKIPNRITI